MERRRLLASSPKGLVNVPLPVVLKQLRVLGGFDVYCDHFRRKPGGELNSLAGDIAPSVDGNHGNRRLTGTSRVDGNPARGEDPYGVVVTPDNDEEKNRQRNEKKRDPGAINELRNQHDDHGDGGYERAQPIDERTPHPMRTAIFPPVHHHPSLRKCESEKSADGKEGNEAVRDAAKKNQKAAAEHRQGNDAVGIYEPPPPVSEDVR